MTKEMFNGCYVSDKYRRMIFVKEITFKKALVNYKCLGHFGRCLRSFTQKQRGEIIDLMIMHGWLNPDMTLTNYGDELVKNNLDLLQK